MGSATYHNAERENVGRFVDAGLGMRFWTAPHQVANLYTNDVAVGIHTSSIFDISKFYLLDKYSVISLVPIDENVIGFDIYDSLITAKTVHALRMPA
jgi:hypothetical protein